MALAGYCGSHQEAAAVRQSMMGTVMLEVELDQLKFLQGNPEAP